VLHVWGPLVSKIGQSVSLWAGVRLAALQSGPFFIVSRETEPALEENTLVILKFPQETLSLSIPLVVG